MKLVIFLFLVSSSVFASSKYSYDCKLTSGEFNVPKYFVLDRFSKEKVALELDGYRDELSIDNIIAGIKKYSGFSSIFGQNNIELFQDQSITKGAGFGDVSVVIDSYSYEYSCSLSWSPY